MSETTSPHPRNYAAVIGLDWSNRDNIYVLRTASGRTESGSVALQGSSLHDWARALCERFDGQAVAICQEQAKGPIVDCLLQHAFIDLYVVHPTTAARYRAMFTPSGDKNDTRDAAGLLDYFLRHGEDLEPVRPPDPQARQLDGLCRARRKAVDERTRQLAALTQLLRQAYPLILDLFDELHAAVALEFLRRWPSVEQLRRARPQTLCRFFHQHNCRCQSRIEARLQSIEQARNTSVAPALETLHALQIDHYTGLIMQLNRSIDHFDQAIHKATQEHPQAFLFQSLPGAGSALAPRLLAAFLLAVRPDHAMQMQTLCGIAPIRLQSGDCTQTRMRRFCPKFLRQTFHEFAGCSIQYSRWARAFFIQARQRGMGVQAAKRALAFKWIRILCACWKNGTAYDENRYIQQLKQRGSPLVPFLA